MFYDTHQCSLNSIRYLNSLCLIHKINFKAIAGEILQENIIENIIEKMPVITHGHRR